MTRLPKIKRSIEFFDIASREIKAVDDELGLVSGYLNVKNVEDLGGDISRDGCFKKSISEAYSRKNNQGLDYLFPLLFNHDMSQMPAGGVVEAREDAKGLFITAKINLGIQAGRDLYSSLKARTLDRFSMGYKAITVEWAKHEGKSIRNLLEVAIMEASVVLFPMAPESVVTSVKSREDYNSMLLRKDFTSNYQSQQLDDWQYDDWSGIAAALQQSIMELFVPGGDPLASFDREVLPGLLAVLRQYISDGIALGYSAGPSSAAGVSPMMSMSGYGAGERKAGYLNSADHSAIKESSAMIMRHAKIIASASARVENANARARAGQLAGWPVYGSMSDTSIFEQKQDEQDAQEMIGLLAGSLEVQNSLRELKELRESNVTENPLVANVNTALQRFLEKAGG